MYNLLNTDYKSIIYNLKLLSANHRHNKNLLPQYIKPIRVDFKITENCNSKCLTCDYWKNNIKDKLNAEKVINILREIKLLKIPILRLTGGEPLLRKDLFSILDNFNSNDFKKIILSTNGLLINQYTDEINKSIISNVRVSIDGLERNNDYIRGVKGYFKKAFDGLSRINKEITIVSVLSNLLVDDLEELIELCQTRNYNYDIHLPDNNTYFFASRHVKENLSKLKLSHSNVLNTLDVLRKHKIITGVVCENARSYLLTGKFKFNHCILGFLKLYIDSQGNVRTGCYEFPPVGNLNNSSINNILKSPQYKKAVLDMFDYKCKGCTCGYGISAIYANPLKGMTYLLKRIKELY